MLFLASFHNIYIVEQINFNKYTLPTKILILNNFFVIKVIVNGHLFQNKELVSFSECMFVICFKINSLQTDSWLTSLNTLPISMFTTLKLLSLIKYHVTCILDPLCSQLIFNTYYISYHIKYLGIDFDVIEIALTNLFAQNVYQFCSKTNITI